MSEKKETASIKSQQEMTMFIKIGDQGLININKIKRIWVENKKNQFGGSNGEYCLHIDMESEYKGMNMTYRDVMTRDECFESIEKQLKNAGRLC